MLSYFSNNSIFLEIEKAAAHVVEHLRRRFKKRKTEKKNRQSRMELGWNTFKWSK